MSCVYLDPTLLPPQTAGDPEVELRHLAEAGFELVLLDEGRRAAGSRGSGRSTGASLESTSGLAIRSARSMDPNGRGDWLLTADPSRCGRARQSVCRTILVGPVAVDERHPVSRCDVVARDLKSAVLEILTSEAMASLA